MTDTTSTVQTWPTVAEIAAVANCMGGETGPHEQVLALRSSFDRLFDLDVAPSIDEDDPPTLETIGVLSSTLAKLRFDLEYALDSVRHMERLRDVMALEAGLSGEASGDA